MIFTRLGNNLKNKQKIKGYMNKTLYNNKLNYGAYVSSPFGNEIVIPDDENPYSTLVGRTDLTQDNLSDIGLRKLLYAQVKYLLGAHGIDLTLAIVLQDGAFVGLSFTNSTQPLTLQDINRLKRTLPEDSYILSVGCKAFWLIGGSQSGEY